LTHDAVTTIQSVTICTVSVCECLHIMHHIMSLRWLKINQGHNHVSKVRGPIPWSRNFCKEQNTDGIPSFVHCSLLCYVTVIILFITLPQCRIKIIFSYPGISLLNQSKIIIHYTRIMTVVASVPWNPTLWGIKKTPKCVSS